MNQRPIRQKKSGIKDINFNAGGIKIPVEL